MNNTRCLNHQSGSSATTPLNKGLLLTLVLALLLPLAACNTVPFGRTASQQRERPVKQVQRPREPKVQITPYRAPRAAERDEDARDSARSDRRDRTRRDERARNDTRPAPRVKSTIKPSGTAVVALLGNANQQSSSGNLDNAAASLERALRIEPRNPEIWSRLAAVRLQQGQYDQASSLAAKSINLAGNNKALIERNRKIIAAASGR